MIPQTTQFRKYTQVSLAICSMLLSSAGAIYTNSELYVVCCRNIVIHVFVQD